MPDQQFRSIGGFDRWADEHRGIEPRGRPEARPSDRYDARTETRRCQYEFIKIIEQRPFIWYPDPKSGVEHAKLVRLERSKPEQHVVQVLRPFDKCDGFGFKSSLFIAKLGELPLLFDGVTG
jgi:hypothetical protein